MKSIKFILALSAVIVLAGISVQYEPAQVAQPVSYDIEVVLDLVPPTPISIPILPRVIPTVGFNVAHAGSTLLVAPRILVSDMKNLTFTGHPRVSIIASDTGGVHTKVPGMSAGDVITRVYYVPWDSLSALNDSYRNALDVTDFAVYHRDTIQYWGEAGGNEGGNPTAVDSGWVHVTWFDITD